MFTAALPFVVSLASASVLSVTGAENPLSIPANAYGSDHETFTRVGSLEAVSSDTFTTFSHPLFPAYSARIKETDFCDPTVKSYTGYIDMEARHIFFYFFESRNDPATDDMIFWTNGGPGCSSSLGLFMENGPCRLTNATEGPKVWDHGWNANANIFFVDQPINVGFSYSEFGESVGTTEAAAQDIAVFIAMFFENFSQFKGRALHMAGESYGGRYVPLFASAVYDHNVLLVQNGFEPVNLTSIMVGNGLTEPLDTLLSYYDMTCTPASTKPVVDISTCVRMKKALRRCEIGYKKWCIDTYDDMNCGSINSFCENELMGPFDATGLNPYDITQQCEDINDLCYPVTREITNYLLRLDVRSELGVDSHAASFSACSDRVGSAFALTQDGLHDSSVYVGALLERGVRVLIYVGTYDWICNWVGNERWTLRLDWSGRTEFAAQELRDWKVDGKVAGKTRSANGLAFATVNAAGHMVPYDKPAEALHLVRHWLADTPL
ncbi:serine carboxypeptidase [Vararia minispora EC-137]|uniref:Serine carboxypeptidase n=1 Tax=Vararia minispora EC-137 TaxID=1314806 RepID=A0ACB8QPG2_9AGAM|nr:serine carboxypeptidase [Vararia minispora EC-137]